MLSFLSVVIGMRANYTHTKTRSLSDISAEEWEVKSLNGKLKAAIIIKMTAGSQDHFEENGGPNFDIISIGCQTKINFSLMIVIDFLFSIPVVFSLVQTR